MTDSANTPFPEHQRPPRHLSEVPAADPTDPPIIMVPGIDGTALLFYRQIPSLARRFDVVAFPLPSTSPRETTMSTLASDLAGLIAEVSDDGAILCGESFGGALAMTTALTSPDLVRGLVIVNSFPYLDQRVQLMMAPLVLRAMPWAAMPLVRRFTSSRLHSAHTLAEDIREFHTRAASIDRDAYIRRLEILRSFDLRDRLAEIDAPTLFLAGDADQLVPSVDWAQFMQTRVPKAEMRVLEGYGHICLINHDLDLLDHVDPWWDSIRT